MLHLSLHLLTGTAIASFTSGMRLAGCAAPSGTKTGCDVQISNSTWGETEALSRPRLMHLGTLTPSRTTDPCPGDTCQRGEVRRGDPMHQTHARGVDGGTAMGPGAAVH